MAGNTLRILVHLIHILIQIYILLIIVRSVMSWMGNIPPNPFTQILRQVTDPVFRLVHRVLPRNVTIIGNIDISPIIIIVVLYLIDSLIASLLLDYAVRLRGG